MRWDKFGSKNVFIEDICEVIMSVHLVINDEMEPLPIPFRSKIDIRVSAANAPPGARA